MIIAKEWLNNNALSKKLGLCQSFVFIKFILPFRSKTILLEIIPYVIIVACNAYIVRKLRTAQMIQSAAHRDPALQISEV